MNSTIGIGVRYGFISVLSASFMQFILTFFGVIPYQAGSILSIFISPKVLFGESTPLLVFFMWVVVFAPITEELIFRFIPIRLTKYFLEGRGSFTAILWTIIVVSSIVFGYAHGLWINIFIQGISGIIFSCAFLRGGYVCSVTAHATHNASIILAAVLFSFL